MNRSFNLSGKAKYNYQNRTLISIDYPERSMIRGVIYTENGKRLILTMTYVFPYFNEIIDDS